MESNSKIEDVQYGATAASVYDWLISSIVAPDKTINRLRPHVTGRRVLDVGVGTGRIAAPVTSIAADVIGVDNSRPMLDVFRAKVIPANMTLVEADFRQPLPFTERFDAAYSTLGPLACVDSREQLITALTHVRDVLEPGGYFALEYYSASAYRPLIELGTMSVPQDGRTVTLTAVIDQSDLLTMGTHIEAQDGPGVEFYERVLFVEPYEIEVCLVEAGFGIEDVCLGDSAEPFDWYTVRRRK